MWAVAQSGKGLSTPRQVSWAAGTRWLSSRGSAPNRQMADLIPEDLKAGSQGGVLILCCGSQGVSGQKCDLIIAFGHVQKAFRG